MVFFQSKSIQDGNVVGRWIKTKQVNIELLTVSLSFGSGDKG